MVDLAAEPGNKQYMNQKAVYKRFPMILWVYKLQLLNSSLRNQL